jgi:phosphatidylinositol phospholipase C delta
MLSRTELLQLFTRYAKKLDNETSAFDVSLTPLPTSPQASMSPPTRILSPPLSTSPPSDTVLSQPLIVSPPTIDALGTYVTGKLSAPPESPELVMSLDGFSSFLLSSDNSAFIDQRGRVWHDMTHPLSDYFVSSSHNTYLTGHQLVGSSTIEGYIRALLHSCRSVECKRHLLGSS